MSSVDNKSLIWFPVENNSCSSYISHEITPMWSVIKLISCSMSIDDIESHTPYFCMFVWRYCSIPGELRNITTKYIISSAGYPYGVLMGKTPKLFLVAWFQNNISCNIRKFLIRTFTFTIDRRCISTCSLNYDVRVMACLNEFRRSFYISILINADEFKFIILIYQFSDNKF